MDISSYESLLEDIFGRHPSVSSRGFAADAYKPGLENMLSFDAALGKPSLHLRCIHVAGTNGKGSVSSMLASALAAQGLSVGLYTSPHLLDFRERARIVTDSGFELVSREYVYEFLNSWRSLFDELGLSFFEITTGLAFSWFASRGVDIAVIEVGLGGRLDSTNIITPELSIITSIGLDHCDLLGDTVEKIAAEKAGVFKPGIPALIWGHDEALDPVFLRQAASVHCPLFFAEDMVPPVVVQGTAPARPTSFANASRCPASLPEGRMDLAGEYQSANVRTALAALRLLGYYEPEAVTENGCGEPALPCPVGEAIAHTAARTGFRGRWEKLHSAPDVICDIGHNPPALRLNFTQLEHLMAEGTYDRLVIIYGIMADKDLAGIIPLMPREAEYIFVTPDTPRALPASEILAAFRRFHHTSVAPNASGESASGPIPSATTADSISKALSLLHSGSSRTLIYIGGSTYVVCEAQKFFDERD